MPQPKTCILGGTGFVGHSIVARLAAMGHNIVILTRHRERNRDLLTYPCISIVEADVHDPETLSAHFHGVDTVINLVGILNQFRGKDRRFDYVHVELTRKVTAAVAQRGVPRLLHMSASNADPDGPSLYLRTKGTAENLVHEHALEHGYAATSFRPSVIFGAGDSFTNRFASLLRSVPVMFPLACPSARLQPVYVNDVAKCFAIALDSRNTFGQTYNLCGPDVYTLHEVVAYIADTIGVNRKIVRLPNWQSRLQAAVLQWFPGKPFTPDNYKSLQIDSICKEPFPKVFDIDPRPLEEMVPSYLNRYGYHSKLDALRRRVPE